MYRYRVFAGEFDYRANTLALPISDEWEVRAKEGHRVSQEQIRHGLLEEFGIDRREEKEANFIELGPRTWSVIAYHNQFAQQARNAFIVGAYYPALAAACALGERILNQLVIGLRDQFQGTPEYARVRQGQALKQWGTMINALRTWGVLRDDVAGDFDRLANKRNNALHFNPDTDVHVRRQALAALRLLDRIISNQFGAIGPKPWFIPGTLGAWFITKAAESDPFVQLIYLPNSLRVGPCHAMSQEDGQWFVHDDYNYGEDNISDEEFRDLFDAAHKDGFCKGISISDQSLS